MLGRGRTARNEKVRTALDNLQSSMDWLRVSVKYLVFDLETSVTTNACGGFFGETRQPQRLIVGTNHSSFREESGKRGIHTGCAVDAGKVSMRATSPCLVSSMSSTRTPTILETPRSCMVTPYNADTNAWSVSVSDDDKLAAVGEALNGLAETGDVTCQGPHRLRQAHKLDLGSNGRWP